MLEVASFLSYAYTKFVRFLIFNSICGLRSTGQDTWWRFVPDPGKFDRLFTDEELYKKYNLTQDEIAIIEGTIAERPFSTVWSWIPKEYQESKWLHVCDCSELAAQIIYNMHNDLSMSPILTDKSAPIKLLEKRLTSFHWISVL